MLRIDGLRLRPGEEESLLPARAAAVLKLDASALRQFHIVRKSIDARKDVFLVYSVQFTVRGEEKILRRCRGNRHVSRAAKQSYRLPDTRFSGAKRPVIAGAGPAGLFCALALARAGAQPVLLERGAPVEQRREDVAFFWKTGLLSPASNVQFGEGLSANLSENIINT